MSPDLVTALREQTPAAPSELRERIESISAGPAPPRRTFGLRRAVVWLAPAAIVGSLAAAVVVGTITSATQAPPAPVAESSIGDRGLERANGSAARPLQSQKLRTAPAPAPSARRAQHVEANLRVLVDNPDELSAATQRALRTTRRLGGYLVAVDYGTPEATEGSATIRVRVPVSRVQAAVVSFSNLGRILGQQTQITDLQQRLDELTRQIRRAKGDRARVAALRRERRQINRRAAYATVDLALTTHEPEQKVVPPSRLERALDDATGILTAELAIAAYVLIVASPFLALLAAAYAGSRAYRRYADQRLLERA